MKHLRSFFIPWLAVISIIVFTGCGSSKNQTGSTKNETPSTRSAENEKNLENFKIIQELHKLLNNKAFRPALLEAVFPTNLKETDGKKIVFNYAKDLAEAEGAAREYRKSEYEVIRTVVADYVSDIALALEAILNSLSTKNEVEFLKAVAQYDYLQARYYKILSCIGSNNLSC